MTFIPVLSLTVKELRTFEPKNVHILNFPGAFLINDSKMNLEDFIELVLLICQKYKMSSDLKMFATTNDSVPPTGTVFDIVKFKF